MSSPESSLRIIVGMDQNLCSGCSLCTEIAPMVFALVAAPETPEVAYVHDGSFDLDKSLEDRIRSLSPGANSWIVEKSGVPVTRQTDKTNGSFGGTRELNPDEIIYAIEAAEECPGENIYIEVETIPPETPELGI